MDRELEMNKRHEVPFIKTMDKSIKGLQFKVVPSYHELRSRAMAFRDWSPAVLCDSQSHLLTVPRIFWCSIPWILLLWHNLAKL